MGKAKYFICLVMLVIGLQAVKPMCQEQTIPAVFLLGEYEEEVSQIGLTCHQLLLSACDNDMNLAFEKWMGMLKDLEDFAEMEKFEINGVRLWMNVYWNKDGTIRHLSFYPKPDSRNIKPAELTGLFEKFAQHYKLPLHYDMCFSHYGSASFPTAEYRISGSH